MTFKKLNVDISAKLLVLDLSYFFLAINKFINWDFTMICLFFKTIVILSYSQLKLIFNFVYLFVRQW